ncbi:hypothetical protein DL771_009018 [Monosporascus sp. 5C6A]|nr:hypothetical protein DL771_009018 [Monosporascus sp. 5C6A]
MAAGEPILYSLYIYAPNIGAAIFFTIARYKAFKLIALYPFCGVLLTVGYVMRVYGAYNYTYSVTAKSPLIIFIISQVYIYIGPPLFVLANYRILGRVFCYVPYCSPLAPRRVLTVFGGLMIFIEVITSWGASLSANPSSSAERQTLGGHLTIAAIVMQIGSIISFFCLAILFHRRCAKANLQAKAVKTNLITLYMSMTLILIRCIYRLVERTGNTSVDLSDLESLRNLNPLLRYEAFFYVFEATLMFINSVLWNMWHPGCFLPKDNHIYLAQDGTEVKGEADSGDRPLRSRPDTC